MEHFLHKIASYIYRKHRDDLPGQCIVFPNRRAGLYFLKYLSIVAGKPIWAPAVRTVNELFSSSSSLKIAENETLVFELYKTYCKLNKGAEKFDDFYFWGELLINDFDDVDKYLADAGRLFKNLADLRKIDEKFGELSEDQIRAIRQFWINFNNGVRSAEKEDFLKIWSILPALYAGFRDSISSKGIAYEGMIFRELAEKCRSGQRPDFNWRNIHFAGFNALNECEKALMHSLKDAGIAKFYWDYDILYTDEDQLHSAGFFIRSNLKEFGNDMPSDWKYRSNLSSGEKVTRSRIIETSSDIAQVKLIPGLLGELKDVNGKESHHTAIVLAEESLLVPLLTSIPEYVEDVNITMGYPLKFTPVYSLISHMLSLQKNCRSEKKELLFDHTDVLNILRHNYYSDITGQEGNNLAIELIAEKRQWIKASRFKEIPELEMIFKKTASPRDLSGYLKSVLEYNYISDKEDPRVKSYNPAEIRIRNEFIYVAVIAVNRLEGMLSSSEITVTVATWTRLLDRIMRNISIPFSGEPLSGLQVMGILETRTLDFRNVILLAANEGVLPRSSGGSSYIPYSLREAYGLPGIKHQDSIYSYYFYRLLHRVENITFVYNSNSEGIRTGEMSRFLHQLNYLDHNKPELSGLGCEILTPERPGKVLMRTEKHHKILEETFLTSGGRAISPSAVNTWLSCRMKFYYKYLCNLKEPEKLLTEIDPALFGTMLHGIMQKIYSLPAEKVLNKSFFEKYLGNTDNIDRIIGEVVKEKWFSGREPGNDGNIKIISNILRSYARMVLKFDSSFTSLSIVALEKAFYSKLDISVKKKILRLNLGGFVDRLDITGNTHRIIDYKTGNVPMDIPSVESLFDENNEKRNEAWFQILMYCEIFSRENPGSRVRPSLYALRSLPGKGFSDHLIIGRGRENGIQIDDYSTIRKEYFTCLKNALESIFDENENFTMTEHTRKCEYCTFRQLCSR